MARTEPTTRDKERTRRAILDAAKQMFSEHGSKASLAAVAKAAGVTQSGLRHHFPTREALLYGVVEHSIEQMWDEIHAHIDLSENRPGKFLRGYIRMLTGDSTTFANLPDPTALSAALGNPAGIEELCRRDAERWKAALEADGLPMARVLVIQHAAEGLAVARSTPYLSEEELDLARTELLAMTEQESPM
ncbi:TetR/AcrR family transcriptional regulator [Rhodococcus rhodochrous]|uniref:TetR/AcrR family transcriptional regulator n=1 Tax=Rhodococcus rhodochrous TaxID=1829 RepID=UPI001E57D11D|nr:TetR family transcriptional regulator [Rhodococcus rhodochrous]MCD2100203.1 TetR family transcriptional regulator [Rhodococcus rhodochrous]MCD2124595.1 TetR family transcriptional regulator [Rhodococcus rhodochrous]MCQ4137575.1 TetR family transcriptional regulator [Rhodococcus rhodochrous]MDJ0021357.1 TetR family transcriptional regulator [Rhodococcus rhodochrous]